jgi:hypothetical protein
MTSLAYEPRRAQPPAFRATPPDLDALLTREGWAAIGGADEIAREVQAAAARHEFATAELEGFRRSMREQAYFITGEVVTPAMRARLLRLIDAVRAHGLNETWATVFDAFWETYGHIGSAMEACLGADYRYVTGSYVFIVESKDSEAGWGKHRDLRLRRSLGADGLPEIMSSWVALTDATPLNSCLYCLPASRDPNYPANLAELAVPRVEDIECMAVRAGQVIGLNHALLHWGSRSSARGAGRRVSFVIDTQRADVDCFHHALLDPRTPLSFAQRAAYVAHVVLWLCGNNVAFSPTDIALARRIVDAFGSEIGLSDAFRRACERFAR